MGAGLRLCRYRRTPAADLLSAERGARKSGRRRLCGDRLGAVRRQAQGFHPPAPVADGAAVRLVRLYDADRRVPGSCVREVGLGVEGLGDGDLPAADAHHPAQDRGVRADDGAVRVVDRDRRRHQDAGIGRRLRRLEPDGRQQFGPV